VNDEKAEDDSPAGRQPDEPESKKHKPKDGESNSENKKGGDHDVVLLPGAGAQWRAGELATHLSLAKDSHLPRAVQAAGSILPLPILGGLHHHYVRI
jgi:hypothetical protein